MSKTDVGGGESGSGNLKPPVVSVPPLERRPGQTITDNLGPPNTPDTPGFDWQSYLTNWGFPPDVVAQLDKIFRSYTDPNQAAAAALAYIRGTDWYATTFPGINEGIKNGLISDESSYRAYTNDLNQYYQRYYGRNASGQDVSSALMSGKTAQMIGAHFQGQAYIRANSPEFQYQLGAFDSAGQATGDQLNALGDQAAGLDNAMGQEIQKRVQLAQAKMQRIFSGTLASPALSILKGSSLQGATLNPAANSPDVAA